jgi:hypothetical protein
MKAVDVEIVDCHVEFCEVSCGGCGSGDLDVAAVDLLSPSRPDGPWYVRCNECGVMVRIRAADLASYDFG